MDWWTGRGVSLGDVLFPHLHFRAAYGDSDGDPEELAAGGHDPNQRGWTVQAIEAGLSLRGGWVEGFANYRGFVDADDHLTGEWEEAFLKLPDLPGGLEVRGGRFLNRFGFHNALHQHAWDWVDTYLTAGRFLGEEGLQAVGGELAVTLPTRWPAVLSLAAGGPPGHGGHAEEAGGEGGHGGHGEGELALFDDYVITADLRAQYPRSDFHRWSGTLSLGAGENGFGRTTVVGGLGVEYLWRENGLEAGGAFLRWRTEVFLRQARLREAEDAHEEHGEEEEGHGGEGRGNTIEDGGASTALVWGPRERLDVAARAEWVSGSGDLGLEERWRISPAVTFYLNAARTVSVRLQYNYDDGPGMPAAHSVWGQFGLDWGGPEVR